MARHSSRAVGAAAEVRACHYLLGQGLRHVESNFRCRLGEIDLIMLQGECLVLVEVRYRRTDRFIAAELTVDRRKQRKLIRAAALYIAGRSRFRNHTVRFDVVAVGADKVNWIPDAFRPPDSSL